MGPVKVAAVQAAPVLAARDATIGKVIALAETTAAEGARLVTLHDGRGAFRATHRLRGVFCGLDVDGDGPPITYCTIGGRASTAWFVLAHLLGRRNVRIYGGSWAEWGRRPDTPADTA